MSNQGAEDQKKPTRASVTSTPKPRPWGKTLALVIAGSALAASCATTSPSQSTGPNDEPLYQKMSDDDVALADAAVQRSLESQLSEETLSWRNPASGNSGSVTPLRTYRASSGVYCREYREMLFVSNESESYREVACRRDGGFWQPL